MSDLEQKIEDKAQKIIELIEHHTVGIGTEHPFYGKDESEVALLMLAGLLGEATIVCGAADIIRQKYGLGILQGRNLAIF